MADPPTQGSCLVTDWGPFLRTARHQRGWTQLRAVEELQRHADGVLPSPTNLQIGRAHV